MMLSFITELKAPLIDMTWWQKGVTFFFIFLATLETQTHTHPCPLQLSYRLRSTLFPFVLTNASPAHKYNPNNYKLTTLTTIQVFTPKDRYIKRWGGVTGLSTCITKIQQKTKLGNNKPCSSSMTFFHSEECNKYTRWGGKDQHNTIISKRNKTCFAVSVILVNVKDFIVTPLAVRGHKKTSS